MAEEWGTVVFSVSDKLRDQLDASGDAADPGALLTDAGGLDSNKVEGLILSFGKIRVREGYAAVEYDCADWRAFSELFVAEGRGIEFYSRTVDEYGACGYFALSAKGERFSFSYDEDGDVFDVAGFEKEVDGKINEWAALLPDELKAQFPGFAGEEEDDRFPDWPEDSELRADGDAQGQALLGSWQWRGRRTVLHFTSDNRVITFKLYSEPTVATVEWLAEDRIRVEGQEAVFQVSNDEATMTFSGGRAEYLDRVDSPRMLKDLDDDE